MPIRRSQVRPAQQVPQAQRVRIRPSLARQALPVQQARTLPYRGQPAQQAPPALIRPFRVQLGQQERPALIRLYREPPVPQVQRVRTPLSLVPLVLLARTLLFQGQPAQQAPPALIRPFRVQLARRALIQLCPAPRVQLDQPERIAPSLARQARPVPQAQRARIRRFLVRQVQVK